MIIWRSCRKFFGTDCRLWNVCRVSVLRAEGAWQHLRMFWPTFGFGTYRSPSRSWILRFTATGHFYFLRSYLYFSCRNCYFAPIFFSQSCSPLPPAPPSLLVPLPLTRSLYNASSQHFVRDSRFYFLNSCSVETVVTESEPVQLLELVHWVILTVRIFPRKSPKRFGETITCSDVLFRFFEAGREGVPHQLTRGNPTWHTPPATFKDFEIIFLGVPEIDQIDQWDI